MAKTIKDLLENVYRLMDTRRKFISEKEYIGKEIDTAYFNGMDDGIREIFGRLDMYKLLDLPLDAAEELMKTLKILEDCDGSKETV